MMVLKSLLLHTLGQCTRCTLYQANCSLSLLPYLQLASCIIGTLSVFGVGIVGSQAIKILQTKSEYLLNTQILQSPTLLSVTSYEATD